MSSITVYLFSHADGAGRNSRIEKAWNLYTGRTEAAEAILEKDGKGCPHILPKPEVYVSISDSDDFWLIAFSHQRIGIDLQRMEAPYMTREKDTKSRCIRLARRFFHPEEAEFVCAEEETEEVSRRFFKIWTAKEAFVKFTGTGIDNSFTEFDVLENGMLEKME
ncbi:MAG: 4'-phosphopantetheinyl transferase superfamily protein, partial [Eubacteriales bacterium]|nr:4'-phosphopantetheinyl transferase superfamily protein [Eubacteriales bacterium]